MGELANLLEQKRRAASAPESQYSTFGFLGNLAGGLGNIAKGLGIAVGRGAWDLGGEAAELFSAGAPGDVGYEHSSQIDDLLKAAPRVIKEDYKKRYGSGLDQFLMSTYEDPTAFLGDIATVLTLGGAGAVKGAQGVSKVPAISDDLVRLAAGSTDDVSRTARIVDKVIPGKKYQQAGIPTATGEAYPLGGVRTRLNQETGRIDEITSSTNPFRRLFDDSRDAVLRRSQPVSKLRQEAELLDEALERGDAPNPTKLAARRGHVEQLLRISREMDVDTMLTPKRSVKQAEKLSSRMFNESGSRFIQDRTEAINNYTRINAPLVEKYGDTALFERYNGLTPHNGPRMNLDEIRTTFDVERGTEPAVAQIEDAVRPLFDRLDEVDDPVAGEKVSRLIEIVAGEPLARRASRIDDDLAEGMDNTRLVTMQQETRALLNTGYQAEDVFDHLYASKRVQYAVENGVSIDDAPDALELDELFKREGLKAPVYYPQPSNITKSTSDYLRKTSRSGAVNKATPKSAKKWEGRNIEAYIRGTSDALETNPTEAYSRLAAEWTGYRSILKLMDNLKENFGVSFTDKASVPEGWMVINPKANRLLLRKNLDVRDQVTRLLREGVDEQQAFHDAVKRVFTGERMEKELAELLDSSGETFAVPEVVAKQFDEAAKWSLSDKWETKARLYYDPAMTAWRTNALYLSPRFYINNSVGNATFLKLQGASLSRMTRQLDGRFRKSLQRMLDELGVRNDVETGLYGVSQQRTTHLGRAAETRTGQVYERVGKTKVAKGASRAADRARRMSSVFEDAARREAFLTAAEKDLAKRGVMRWQSKFATTEKRLNTIMKYGVDNPRAAQRWLDEMNDTMNNYQNLSPFERKIVRRFLVPFWPFFKHASKTLISLPYKHPVKARALLWLTEIDKELDETGERPDFLDDYLHLGPGDEPGTEKFLSTRGANPLSGVVEPFLPNIGPVPQMAFEQATGRDVLTGKQFSSEDVYSDAYSGQQFRLNPETGIPEPIEKRFGVLAPVGPDMGETLWGLAGPAGVFRDAFSEGARFSGSGEVIRDDYGQPAYPVDPAQELLKLLGVSTMDYNLTDYQSKLREAQGRAAGALRGR